jgi:hypothetical protein
MLSLRHSHTTDRSSILASRQVVSIRIKARHRIGHLVYNVLRWRLEALDAWREKPKKGYSGEARGLGSGGKSAENSPPMAPFSAAFSQVPRLYRIVRAPRPNEEKGAKRRPITNNQERVQQG